jgi:DNA repair protein RecO (recombination protein O)
MSLLTTSAVLLRAYPYSETSRILRFYTSDAGVVGALARGIRKTVGATGSGLQTFAGGLLTLHVRSTRELQTFKEFNATHPRPGIGRSPLRLGGASLLAELVLRHAGEEANPSLFGTLDNALDRLNASDEADVYAVVLSESWRLVSVLGYHPVLEVCVHCGKQLGGDEMSRFDFSAGGVRCADCGDSGPRVGPGARAQLRGLVAGDPPAGPLTRPRAHLQILSDFITYHVSGTRPLGSFAFLSQMLPEDDA